MGVVSKTEDVKLHRFVALRFLPNDIAKDPQALARFEREAQAASALNRSNRHVGHPLQFAEFSIAKTARGTPEQTRARSARLSVVTPLTTYSDSDITKSEYDKRFR